MHDDGYYPYQRPFYSCWNCGARGRLTSGGLLICYVCDVMWSRWPREVIAVDYAPLYETV